MEKVLDVGVPWSRVAFSLRAFDFICVMSDNRGHDYDHVTSFLGDCGCFQKTICVLLSMSAIPVGYMGVDSVFTSHTPEFRCKASGNSTDSSSWGLPDSCSWYKTNATQGPGVSNDTEPCLDGWDFSNDTQIYTIATEVRKCDCHIWNPLKLKQKKTSFFPWLL